MSNAHKIYEIGSITKTFTASLMMLEAQNGSLSLEDSLYQFIPIISENPTSRIPEINLRQLATHSSGLPRLPGNLYLTATLHRKDPYRDYQERQLYNWLNNHQLVSVPGSEWIYSNIGYALLGLVISHAAKQPFEYLLEQQILGKLQMNHTSFILGGAQEELAMDQYGKNGSQTPMWNANLFNAAGGLKSNMNDMLKWLRANLKNGADSLTTGLKASLQRPLVHISDSTQYQGLGWIQFVGSGPTIYWHNGSTNGSHSFFGFNLEARQGVILLVNYAAQHRKMNDEQGVILDRTGFEILNTL